MISSLKGKVVIKTSKYTIIEVSGVGYKVFSTSSVLNSFKTGEEIQIWTYLAVRENSLDLYGFLDIDELDFFELLISISGIGPKGALGILSVADVKTLSSAISSGDTTYLTKVSGIGKKSAEKIVLELKDKAGFININETSGQLKEGVEAIEALKSLGYRHQEARDALNKVPPKITGVSEKVREALRILGN